MLSTFSFATSHGGCAMRICHASCTASRTHALSLTSAAICGTLKRRSSQMKNAGTPMGTIHSQMMATPTYFQCCLS